MYDHNNPPPGYANCTREEGHEGSYAHPLIDIGFYEPDKRSLWEKFWSRCYPSYRVPHPEAPANYEETMEIVSVTRFDFLDRLRILFSGYVIHESVIVCLKDPIVSIGGSKCYPITKNHWLSMKNDKWRGVP